MSTICASSLRQGVKLIITFIIVKLLFGLRQSEMSALCAKNPKTKMTCRAGTFLAGQNASVSCNFPTDVAADGDDVIVSRLPVNASKDAIWFDTLVCSWEHSKKSYRCDVTQGFRFDGVITDHLTLHIPDVSNEKAGTYICFIVSSDIPSTECELTVKENQHTTPETKTENSTSYHSNEKGEGINVVVFLPTVIILVVLAGLSIFVSCHLKFRTRTRPEKGKQLEIMYDPMSAMPLISIQLPDEKVVEHLEMFELTTTDCEQIRQRLHEEMGNCKRWAQRAYDDTDISHEGHEQASKKWYSVPLKCLPTETKGDDISVVEICNAILRIHNVSLQDPQPKTTCTKYPIPEDIKLGTGIQLLDFIADCAQKVCSHKLHRNKLSLGFVFAFPCEYQHDLTQARFTTWNSGFRLDDLVGKDVQEMLCDAFRRKHPKSSLKVTFIFSHAAGILLSFLNEDHNCRIGVSLADNFHACYLQRENSSDTHTADDNMMITDIVLGAYGQDGCLNKFITEYDKQLDLHSACPGKQILEKMVSMAFIGEIVRLVLTSLANKGLLFSSHSSMSVLNKKKSFTADHMSLIQSDKSEPCLFTDYVLRQLQIEYYTEDDCRTVRYVARTVLKRAAHLAATVLAVLVNQTDTPKVTIAVDGDLCRCHPIFLGLLRDMNRELINSEKEVEFKAPNHGSAIGAALAVNVPKSSQRDENLHV